MAFTEKTVFVTEDGHEHDTAAAACRHEEMLKLAKELAAQTTIFWRQNVNVKDVASYILKHYVLIPKDQILYPQGGENLMLKHLDVLKKTVEDVNIIYRQASAANWEKHIKELKAALTYFDILVGKLV